MATPKKLLELHCSICSETLTSKETELSRAALKIIAKQNRSRQFDYTNSAELEPQQVVATKCGHMFHMGCLRKHIKNSVLDRFGAAPCPMCSKPVTLSRLWPVLVPTTPAQIGRKENMKLMIQQITETREQLAEIAREKRERATQLQEVEEEMVSACEEIEAKQNSVNGLTVDVPSGVERKELRRALRRRQPIVKAVTKHNADLLGLLMHEANVRVSETDFLVSDDDLAIAYSGLDEEESSQDLVKISEGCGNHRIRTDGDRSRRSRSRSRHLDVSRRKETSRSRRR